MSIQDKVNDLKKEFLLDEASKLFEEIGYEQMKIATLAKNAKVSVGTIYLLFNSKEGLYLAYIDRQVNNLFLELQGNTSKDNTSMEKIRIFIETKFSHVVVKRKAIEQAANSNPLFFTSLYNEHSSAFQNIYKYISECFTDLNQDLNPDKAYRMAYALNGFTDGYISQWLDSENNLMDKVDEVFELFTCILEDKK